MFTRHRQLGERRVAMAGGSGYPARMTTLAPNRYAGHRFPPEIISHAVWLYFRFPLSLRMVEEMLAARGIVVSHEAVRQWALKFGQGFANEIRRRACREPATSGISMRSSSRSPGRRTGCGAPSTSTASCSTSWFRAGVMRKPPSGCFASS